MRKRATFNLPESVLDELDRLHKLTRIPKSRIVEDGIEKRMTEIRARYAK